MRDLRAYLRDLGKLAFAAWNFSRNLSLLFLALIAGVLYLVGLELIFTDYAGQFWLRSLAGAFVVFVLVAAPSRLWQTQQREISLLSSKIAALIDRSNDDATDRERRREVVRDLGKLIQEGNALRRRDITGNPELERLREDASSWRAKSAAFIGSNLSRAQKYYFLHPGTLVVQDFQGSYNSDHSSIVCALARDVDGLEHLQALADY